MEGSKIITKLTGRAGDAVRLWQHGGTPPRHMDALPSLSFHSLCAIVRPTIGALNSLPIQSGKMKHNPDMDKSAVWGRHRL